MTFAELIDRLTIEQVDTWWKNLTIGQAPKELGSSWKYHLFKDGHKRPYKSAIRDLAETYNLDLELFSSEQLSRDKFCEKFGFSIKEDLRYDNSELRKFKDAYQKVRNKANFKQFIAYSSKTLKELEIEPYNIRMGIRPNTFMAVIGMRGVMYYSEENGKTAIYLILSNAFLESIRSKYRIIKELPLKGSENRSFVTFQINDWKDIGQDVLDNNKTQIQEEYNAVKKSKRTKWHQDAKTTNSALKYILFKNPDIETLNNGEDDTQQTSEIDESNNKKNNMNPLNQILYGPPGTGKTYNTINKALEILGEHALLSSGSRSDIKQKYDEYVNAGQIVFTTFHQSMSYEDFIEGIKPNVDTEDEKDNLSYEIKPGLFKLLCDKAKEIVNVSVKVDWDAPKYYKMSLGGKHRPEIYNYCIANNRLSLGYGGDQDLTQFLNYKKWEDYKREFTKAFPEMVKDTRYNIQATYAFLNMKVGDIVVVSKGNHIIDAIGRVKGDYYRDDNSPIEHAHFRDVEWIATDLNISPERFINKKISQMSIYEFYKADIKYEAFKALTANTAAEKKNYVIIIDEINRGNVSQIFGELITLIEEDKRHGKAEALELVLPYSKSKFSVPVNVYIIGTMNTADRSVEALDTALRRRFVFEELSPEPARLEGRTIEGINLQTLLETINARIEKLLDRDHRIGHAFFIPVQSMVDLTLVFQHKIIPLLQEYFYGDIGKVCLVLGDTFVQKHEEQKTLFASRQYDSSLRQDFESRVTYTFTSPEQWDFKSIYA